GREHRRQPQRHDHRGRALLHLAGAGDQLQGGTDALAEDPRGRPHPAGQEIRHPCLPRRGAHRRSHADVGAGARDGGVGTEPGRVRAAGGSSAVTAGLGAVMVLVATQAQAASYPAPTEGDFTVKDFRFASGESLPQLRIHYRSFGTPRQDAHGVVRNAVLILHGTGGSGASLVREEFAGELFGPGQLLDAARYYLVLPDGIGHGKSSRPSDGLHMRFPKYTYDDMVRAEHHLRLVMGTSMGGMHTWVWGYSYPDAMDALMPLASLPVEIAGRNRMMRKMAIDSITGDPEWKQGDYKTQPRGLIGAIHVMVFMTSSPLQWQKEAPTREKAEAFLDAQIKRYAS